VARKKIRSNLGKKQTRKKQTRKKQTEKNLHHIRARSRGGKDKSFYPKNEILIDKKRHSRLHNVFANLRLGEIILLLLFSWDTICPQEEGEESHTYRARRGFVIRKTSWKILFGESASQKSVIESIIKEFARTREDKNQIKEALELGSWCGVLTHKEVENFLNLMGITK